MPRFYCPCPLPIGTTVSLPEYIVRHLQVLRMAAGDGLTLFNGEGGEFAATLTSIDRKQAQAMIDAFTPREAELPYAIRLAQALPEGSKMDWIIEKAVELGAAAIEPLAAQRCVTRLSAERATKKISHWQGIVIAASEQCGRNRLAQVTEPADFRDWIAQSREEPRILLTPRAEQSLSSWARAQPPRSLTLMIGPEGGFSAQEEELALARGALPLSMGNRVLRTETAALAALAALNGIWGEI